jgi:sulfinoalanine decarboxylase
LEQIVDQQFELANVALEYTQNNPDYTVYSFDDSVSICFNYKNIEPMTLCTALYEDQITVVGFGAFRDETFIRLVTINANNTKKDILNFFRVLEEFVAKTPNLAKVKEEVQEQL